MSNSLTELNNFSNQPIVFQDNRPYTITFSSETAQNTSTDISENEIFVVPTGIDIVDVTGLPGNITYTINASGLGNVIGNWPDPLPAGISNTSVGNVYSITGVFSSNTWDIAKNFTLQLPGRNTDFSFTANLAYPNVSDTNVTDTWTWTNNVQVTEIVPQLFLTTEYGWNEDQPTELLYSVNDPDPTATYTLTFDQTTGPNGVITVNGVTAGIGNVATVVGNLDFVNSAEIVFFPVPDSASNVQIAVSASKTNIVGTTVIAANVMANLTNISSHQEFSLTTAYNYTEDQLVPLVFDITDLAPDYQPNTSYSISINQTSGNAGVFFINDFQQGNTNSIVLTGSKDSINLATLKFLPAPDDVGNVGLTYTQVKTTEFFGNVTQANNIPLGLVCTQTHPDFDFPLTANYSEDNFINFGNIVTDIDPRATSYTINLQQTGGTTGQWYVNNNLAGNATTALNITDSKAGINSRNISFLPQDDDVSTLTFVFSQSKENSAFGTVIQADGLVATYTGIPNTDIINMIDRTYTSNTVNSIFSASTPVLDDGLDRGQVYTITLESTLGKFGTGTLTEIVAQPSYTFTGSMDQVNQQFSLMKFVPTAGEPASTGTFRYTQSKNSVLQVDRTLNLVGTNVPFFKLYEFTFQSGNSSYTPQPEEIYFGSNMRVIVVGGGGGGGCRIASPSLGLRGGGGGGMGGAVRIEDWGKFPAGRNLFFSINNGGAGSTGSPSFVGSPGFPCECTEAITGGRKIIAPGGKGGQADAGAQPQGDPAPIQNIESPEGNFTYFGGSHQSDDTRWYRGGGPGATGNGVSGSLLSQSSGPGGPGYQIPGTNIVVSRGGGGSGTDRALGISPAEPGSGGGGGRSPTPGANGRPGVGYLVWT